jgi:hypothetical protein
MRGFAVSLVLAGCVSPEPPLVEDGCQGVRIRAAVREACAGIALDLEAPDTWSRYGDSDEAVTNRAGTGACDAAARRVDAIMSAHRPGTFALSLSRGACHADAAREGACDPRDVAAACDGLCQAQAFCLGRVELASSCRGWCEARCNGRCTGTCIAPDGARTENDASCGGKCTARCEGTCSGRCKVEERAGLWCGAGVDCKGGCLGSAREARCETDAVCDPPAVELFADASAGPDVARLVETIGEHLPELFRVAQSSGRNVVQACGAETALRTAVRASGNVVAICQKRSW